MEELTITKKQIEEITNLMIKIKLEEVDFSYPETQTVIVLRKLEKYLKSRNINPQFKLEF